MEALTANILNSACGEGCLDPISLTYGAFDPYMSMSISLWPILETFVAELRSKVVLTSIDPLSPGATCFSAWKAQNLGMSLYLLRVLVIDSVMRTLSKYKEILDFKPSTH